MNTLENLEKITSEVVKITRETGQFIREQIGKLDQQNVEMKDDGTSLNNFVTYVDKMSESKLINGLEKLIPGAGFIAEESGITQGGNTYNWIIDPLDGTTNFIHQLPPFAISVGLAKDNEVIIGVIYEINLDECFYAWKGGKAYLNGKEIRVSQAKTVQDSLVCTGFPYTDYQKMPGILGSLEFFIKNSHGMRRLGSAATDLCYVACGRLDAFFEYALCPWDVAAGSLIVQQAGGRITDFSGGNNYLFGKEIVAANNLVFNEFLSVISRFFSPKGKE